MIKQAENRVLIVDDEVKLRSLLAKILQYEGYEVSEAGSLAEARKMLQNSNIDLLVCDVKLPDGNGVEFLPEVRKANPYAEVIVLTAYGNIGDGVKAIQLGAFDYITKGDDNNKIIPLLQNAAEKVSLARKVNELQTRLGQQHTFESILGNSVKIKKAIDAAKRVALTDATVLLHGETGTGKEVFAQAIHQASARKSAKFIAVNCAAFSRELLENELFGHKAGAFTGAHKDSKGIFEEADKGTVFLDEIGEMQPELQAKLLRVLESGEFIKIGDNKPVRVNVRIVCATNRNLELEIEKGRFREDLYYRISAFTISLPSLKERSEDIPLLANHFLQVYGPKSQQKPAGFTAEYLNCLKSHAWKGNIRELKNVVERSTILADSDTVGIETLPSDFTNPGFGHGTALDLASMEKAHILSVLEQCGGNKTEAAKVLNIAVATLYRKLEDWSKTCP